MSHFSSPIVFSIKKGVLQVTLHLSAFEACFRKKSEKMTQTNIEPGSFGSLLKAFRQRQRLTQQQLAQSLGMNRNAIGRWEQGDFLPASKTIVLELARSLCLNDQETRQLLEASMTALSPYWYVPFPRNPFFTGREETLDALHAQLGSHQAVALTQSYALHGLGGVGKTQIALEYAYQHALDYHAVFWIGAETEEQLISSLLHIAEVLQLPERNDKEQQRVIAAVQHWLSSHSQWLVICDNVEDLDLVPRFLPAVRSGAILITTRSQTLGTLAQGVDLLPMAQEEGMLFLLRRAKVLAPEATREEMQRLATQMPTQYDAAAELVNAMGGLPLALDQAGAYLEETRCGVSAYLDLFHSRRAVLLQQRGEGVRDHPASVSTTFALAIAATTERHPAVGDLLRVCALLQPDAIPEELFRQGAEHLGSELAAVCRDELEWNRLLAVACSYSLLHRQPEERTLSLHRLMQAVLYESMNEREQTLWQRGIIAALNTLFPKDVFEVGRWSQCERLLPHVMMAIAPVSDQVVDLARTEVLQKTANYLLARGQYEQAKPLCLQALYMREQLLGPQHPDLAHLLYSLARLSHEQGKYEQAKPFLKRALQIIGQGLGSEHFEMIYPLNGLSLIYWRQGKYGQAESLLARAVSIGEQAWGPEHPNIGTSLNNLAILYAQQGKYEQAEPLLARAVSIGKQAWGPEHPKTSNALNNLGELYVEQGKYEQAEPLLRKALQIREQAWGPEHPEVARPREGLARLYMQEGRYEQAEPLYQQVLDSREQALGPEHPEVAHVLDNLADLSVQQGKDELAESSYKRALHIWEQTVGVEHPNMAVSLNGLANLYARQDKNAEAESLYQRALRTREQGLGPEHPDTAKTLHDLAALREKQGHLDEALSLTRRALSIRSQALGDAHPKTVATRTLLAQLEQELACAGDLAVLPHGDAPSLVENDALQSFLDACCELHPRAWCRSADLWGAYARWAQEHQERFPLSRRAFTTQLKAHGCRADRTNKARIWRGIGLLKQEP